LGGYLLVLHVTERDADVVTEDEPDCDCRDRVDDPGKPEVRWIQDDVMSHLWPPEGQPLRGHDLSQVVP